MCKKASRQKTQSDRPTLLAAVSPKLWFWCCGRHSRLSHEATPSAPSCKRKTRNCINSPNLHVSKPKKRSFAVHVIPANKVSDLFRKLCHPKCTSPEKYECQPRNHQLFNYHKHLELFNNLSWLVHLTDL